MLVKVTDKDNNEVWIDVESVRKVVKYGATGDWPARTQVITEDGSDVWTNELASVIAERINSELR